MSITLSSRLSQQLEESVWSHAVVGATAAVDLGPGNIWCAAAGNADLSQHIPMAPEARFLIYSNTKTFIALSILKLVGSGKLELDDKLAVWFPHLPITSGVTVRQALNHTAGIPDYGALKQYHDEVKSGQPPWTFEQLIEHCCLGQPDFAPGQGWRYSNTGYALLLKVIEAVTNENASQFMHSNILVPLELTQTSAATSKEDLRQLVAGYSKYLSPTEAAIDVRGVYDPRWVLTGVLASNCAELAQFYRELFTGGMLTVELIDQMCRSQAVPQSRTPFVSPGYGLGLMSDTDSRYGEMYGHTGDGPGYCSTAFHFPDVEGKHVTVSVLCNSEGCQRAEAIMFDLMNVLTD